MARGVSTNGGVVNISDGSGTANVSVPGPNLGASLLVSSGQLVASTTINNQTGAITGTTVDFGSAKSNFSLMIRPGAGVSGGVIDLQVSQDGTNWVKVGNSSSALAATTNQALSASGLAFRYARAVSSTNVAGGNVTVTAMAT